MDCDWIFINQDRSRIEITLQETAVPNLGDGKAYNGKGYEVVAVVTNRVSAPDPLVIAVEFI
jgi:hypothetical protein